MARSLTVPLDGNDSVDVSVRQLDTPSPNQVEFVIEGNLTMTEGRLATFAGESLSPATIAISVGGARPITIDFTEEPSLRLESIDVGVATPTADEISSDLGPISSDDGGGGTASKYPGTISFTIEGGIRDVPEDTYEQLTEGPLTLETITFALDETLKSDGGTDDVLVEFTLLGYGVVIYRTGLIEIGSRSGGPDFRAP